MYRVAIIGSGMIANSAHIPAYRHLPEDFDIVGISDVSEASAKGTAERNGIPRFFTDAEQMLRELRPDVVSVCVPNCFHKKFTALALEYGANVLCEKPLAFCKRDAEELFALAKQKGKLLMACQSMRFTPDRLAARQLIARGGMDEVYYGELSRVRRRGIPFWGSFHMKKISGGGAFVDIGVHMLDAAVWLMGNPPVRSVSASACCKFSHEIGSLAASGALTGTVHNQRPFNPDEMDVEDFAAGTVSFENGARLNFKVAWAANAPEEASIRLLSSKAGIDLPSGIVYKGMDTNDQLDVLPSLYPNEPFFGHFYLTDNLRDVLNGKAEPIVKPAETIAVSTILELFYRSAALGREVTVSELS